MIRRNFALALLICAVLLGGCGGLGGEPEIAATADPRPAAVAPGWRPDIALGARIFAERCVDCHGVAGDGMGELVIAGSVERPLDLTERALVMEKSPLGFYEIVTQGRIEKLMPPWEQALSEAERWAATMYSYTLAYDVELLARGERVWREGCGDCELPSLIPPIYSDVEYAAKLNREFFASALPASRAQAAAAYARMRSLAPGPEGGSQTARAASSDIRGRLLHGTAGGVVPADSVVRLRYGNDGMGYRLEETTVADDGAFQFDDVPLSRDFDYALGAVYEGRLFSQRVFPWREAPPTVTIFATAHDPEVVSVRRIDLTIEPATLADLGQGLLVSQTIAYRNRSDRLFTSGRGFDDGREASLLIQFPLGARLVSGDANGRYIVIEGMERLPDSVIDTLPLPPGDGHEVILDYWLPYAGALQFEQAFNNPMDAAVTIRLAADLRVESDRLRRTAADPAVAGYVQYGGDLRMQSAPALKFGLSGDPYATSRYDRLVVTSETLPALLLAAVALAGALLGGFGLFKRRKDHSGGEIESLAGELARLEEDHDQGRINHDLYHRRRRELRAKLARLMERRDE